MKVDPRSIRYHLHAKRFTAAQRFHPAAIRALGGSRTSKSTEKVTFSRNQTAISSAYLEEEHNG